MHCAAISLSELGLERPPIAAFPRPGTYSYQDENNRSRALDLLIDLVLPDSVAYLSAARWGVFLTSAGGLFLWLANLGARYGFLKFSWGNSN